MGLRTPALNAIKGCSNEGSAKRNQAGDHTLKKGGSENLFARWSRWHRNHRVGSPTRSAFLQGSNLFHTAQTRVIGVSRLNQSR